MLFNARKHFCVINAPIDNDDLIYLIGDAIADICDKSGLDYAFIIHDNDFGYDGDNYYKVRKHIHLFIDGKIRFTSEWLISSLREYLAIYGIDFSNEQFSDRKVINDISCLQYLIHKNNIDKYQYSIDDVVTNNDKYLQLINDGVVNVDENKLISLVNSLSYYELLSELGIEYCRLNHNIIMHLYKLKRSGL